MQRPHPRNRKPKRPVKRPFIQPKRQGNDAHQLHSQRQNVVVVLIQTFPEPRRAFGPYVLRLRHVRWGLLACLSGICLFGLEVAVAHCECFFEVCSYQLVYDGYIKGYSRQRVTYLPVS